ncbi:MAG: hypothetical protein AAF216_02880 [Pseudomonadota bacterium]
MLDTLARPPYPGFSLFQQGSRYAMTLLRSALGAAAAALLIGGCSSIADEFDSRQNVGPCPTAASIYDSSRIIVLDGAGELYPNIEYTGEITRVELFCRYAGSDPLVAQVEIDFAFGEGPAADIDERDFGYFVAVTRRNGTVLAREDFMVEADFSDGPIDAASESISEIVIPRNDESVSGANFEVLVGFILTDDQLKFNRDGKRFRLDAGVQAAGN